MQSWIVYGAACLAVGALFTYLTVRRGSLTWGGALAAVVLGTLVTFSAGPAWLFPLFVFFGSSVLVERLLPGRQVVSDEKDDQPRDAVQVLCNGGIYGLLALLDASGQLLLIAMAVATADTWASAVGKYFGQPTYDMLRLRRVPVGLSGGVSGAGTAGGAAGAGLIALLGYMLLPEFSGYGFFTVALWGWWGMLLDSVLGAVLQARYQDEELRLTDRAEGNNRLVNGYAWLTNDLVNLLAVGLTVGLATWAL
jgi:uncharacterized protein (TIGR00297 family)